MIKLDLMTWKDSEIDILASFYSVPKRLPKKQRIDTIARHIYENHIHNSNMDPDEESRLIAEQAERRKQLQRLQQQWKTMSQNVQPVTDENSKENENIQDCYSNIDIFTQDPFKPHEPILHIRYIHTQKDLSNPKTTCYSISSFFDFIESIENKASQWIREYDPIPELKNLEPERVFDMTSEGHNGFPSLVRVVSKLPDKSAYVIDTSREYEMEFYKNFTSSHPDIPIDPTRYNAFLVSKNMRIGNMDGTFFISQTHGQLPGYDVYLLLPEMNEEFSLAYLTQFLQSQLSLINYDDFLLTISPLYQKRFISFLANETEYIVRMMNILRTFNMKKNDIELIDNDTIHHILTQLIQQSPDVFQLVYRSIPHIIENIDDVLDLLRVVYSLETVEDQEDRSIRTEEYVLRVSQNTQHRQDNRPLVSYHDILYDDNNSDSTNDFNTESPENVQRRLSFSESPIESNNQPSRIFE